MSVAQPIPLQTNLNTHPVTDRIFQDAKQHPCWQCPQAKICLPKLLSPSNTLSPQPHLQNLVHHKKPLLHAKENLFNQGSPFENIYIIRSGSVKTSIVSQNGEEHITGFYFPGDVVGTDGISISRYASTATALETASVCSIPFAELERMSSQIRSLQHYVFKLMALEIQREQRMMMLLCNTTAEQRVASFLMRMADHCQNRNLSASEFKLPMSRGELGNYLGLALETVCRVLTRFQKQGLLRLEHRFVMDLDRQALKSLSCTGQYPLEN